jgi:hypothetical protein
MNIQSYDIIKILKTKPRLSLWERFKRWLLVPLTLMFLTPQANATETDKAAHFGVSFALTTGFYGLYKAIGTRDCRLALDRPAECPLKPSERLGAAAFAAASSFALGLLKEVGDSKPDGRDIIANGLGGLSAFTSIVLFEF